VFWWLLDKNAKWKYKLVAAAASRKYINITSEAEEPATEQE
jgi:hypothetical protein